MADKGLKLVTARGATDPAGGLAVLDAVRPLVLDTRPLDAQRLPLLRQLAAAEPANLDVVVPLASLLDEQGQLDEAKKLLLPVKDQLGDGDGARVLGTIFGREGNYDGAYALLWPYVKSRLDQLHAAEQNWQNTVERLEQAEIRLLEQDEGPREFYAKYEAASKDGRRAIVQEYLHGRLKDNPEYAAAQEQMERDTAVVPVALELGIIMLQRAEGQASPESRKSQLEQAEQVFLAVRGVAGETDEYRLSLGQVYYWLGRQADGRKLFDDYLAAKGRAAADVLRIGYIQRSLGAETEARGMAEEAYGKGATPQEKYAAASLRSVLSKDNDDQIAWLAKADPGDAAIKASLAKAQGDRAMEQGRDDEAARQYQGVLDAYAARPRSSTTLNESALASYGMYQATGDDKALQRCYDYFQQAVDLEPSDTVLLSNAGFTLLSGALADVVGDAIDLRALRTEAGLPMLGHLYRDQAGRDAVVKRVKAHPGVARALSYVEKVTVLAPKNANAFSLLYVVHQFTRDEAALRKLEQRLRSADLDTSDQLERAKEFVGGAKDAQRIPTLTASLKRGADLIEALRPKGGRTAAVALCDQAETILGLDAYTGTADLDQAVALAQEADRLNPSAATSGTVTAALVTRAARQLRRADPAFDAFLRKYERSAGVAHLMAFAASEPGPFQKAVLGHADVKKALAIIRGWGKLFPDGGSPYEWALLKNAAPAEAKRLAEHLKQTPRERVEQTISLTLNPASASAALESYWLLQALGETEASREPLRKVAVLGVPVPLEP